MYSSFHHSKLNRGAAVLKFQHEFFFRIISFKCQNPGFQTFKVNFEPRFSFIKFLAQLVKFFRYLKMEILFTKKKRKLILSKEKKSHHHEYKANWLPYSLNWTSSTNVDRSNKVKSNNLLQNCLPSRISFSNLIRFHLQ